MNVRLGANIPRVRLRLGDERLRDNKRLQYGVPPLGNFTFVQHVVLYLMFAGERGFVLTNGTMSSNQSVKGEIRSNLTGADLRGCMVALPSLLFYSR